MSEKLSGGTLYGASLSPFVRKVRAVLVAKRIDYTLVNVMPGAMEPDFLAKSPLSKIPVWEEADGWTLPDSSAICAYLERCVPSPRVYPEPSRALATSLFWEEYADTRLVESGTPIFFQRVVRQRVFKAEPDEAIVQRYEDDVLPRVLDQLEALFIERDRADPAEFSVANIAVWSPFVNLEHAGYVLDAKRWPGLAAFLAKLGAHPVLAGLVEEERAALASF